MKRKNIDEIKKLESKPKIVKIFTDKEINSILELYNLLPTTVYNKKQNIIKKRWLQNYNKPLDELYISKIGEVLDDYKMDNLISEKNEDFLGLFHESFSPLKLHVDSGFNEKDIIYKRWYGKSTSFTIDEEELNFKPEIGQNERSREHIGNKEFDKEIHKKYLSHIDINNLRGLEVELIYTWKTGETLIMDRTHIHCSSSNIVNKKIGLTTFTKK